MALFVVVVIVLLAYFFSYQRGEAFINGAPNENRTQTETVREVTERFNTTRQGLVERPTPVTDGGASPEGNVL